MRLIIRAFFGTAKEVIYEDSERYQINGLDHHGRINSFSIHRRVYEKAAAYILACTLPYYLISVKAIPLYSRTTKAQRISMELSTEPTKALSS